MAKKKVSLSDSKKPQEQQAQKQQQQEAMDNDKLESLKSLNQRLLKEAVEGRELVKSLTQSKGSLEREITRSNSETERLRSQLTQLAERAAVLEVERDILSVFVAVQVDQHVDVAERESECLESRVTGLYAEVAEKEREIERLVQEKESETAVLDGKLREVETKLTTEREISRRARVERDEAKVNLDLQMKEANELRTKLIEKEEKWRVIQEEVENLRVKCNNLAEEIREREKNIALIMRDKELREKSLMELIEEMKMETQVIVREKEGIEKEKHNQMVKRSELENEISGLNEMVKNLRKEKEWLRLSVAELEKRCVDGEDRQKEMTRRIDDLLREKELGNKRLGELIEERNSLEKEMHEVLTQLDEQGQKMGEMVGKNAFLVESNNKMAVVISALEKQVVKTEAAVSELEDCREGQVEKIKNLEWKLGEYRDALEQCKVERDGVRKCLDEEKRNAMELKEKVEEMSKYIEETLKAAEEAKAENVNILGQKKELESLCETLKKQKVSLEDALVQARNECDAKGGKIRQLDANTKQVLNMLRHTAALLSSKDDVENVTNGDALNTEQGEEIKPYTMELEVIKNAFKTKETKVENMKQQLESLQSSVVQAHKKKNFWTLLSSATTLIAAVTLAYVTRGH